MSNYNNTVNPFSQKNVLKISMITFLAVQAIHQLVLVNSLKAKGQESPSGQVAAWFIITLSMLIAVLLAQSSLSSNTVRLSFFALVIGILGSGIAYVYDSQTNTKNVDSSRMFFGISHIIFGVFILMFLLYNLFGQQTSAYP